MFSQPKPLMANSSLTSTLLEHKQERNTQNTEATDVEMLIHGPKPSTPSPGRSPHTAGSNLFWWMKGAARCSGEGEEREQEVLSVLEECHMGRGFPGVNLQLKTI